MEAEKSFSRQLGNPNKQLLMSQLIRQSLGIERKCPLPVILCDILDRVQEG